MHTEKWKRALRSLAVTVVQGIQFGAVLVCLLVTSAKAAFAAQHFVELAHNSSISAELLTASVLFAVLYRHCLHEFHAFAKKFARHQRPLWHGIVFALAIGTLLLMGTGQVH